MSLQILVEILETFTALMAGIESFIQSTFGSILRQMANGFNPIDGMKFNTHPQHKHSTRNEHKPVLCIHLYI